MKTSSTLNPEKRVRGSGGREKTGRQVGLTVMDDVPEVVEISIASFGDGCRVEKVPASESGPALQCCRLLLPDLFGVLDHLQAPPQYRDNQFDLFSQELLRYLR